MATENSKREEDAAESGDTVANRWLRRPKELAASQKAFEEDYRTLLVTGDKPMIARIDGHCFSTFTKPWKKPFDRRIANAMVDTAADLMTKFAATAAYTFSDEISLVFPPLTEVEAENGLAFHGKVVKLCTLMSGYASVRFVHHLRRQVAGAGPATAHSFNEEEEKLAVEVGTGSAKGEKAIAEMLADPEVHFDARLFNVDSMDDVAANIAWRSAFDCRRNSVGGLARVVLHHSATQSKKQPELVAAMAEKGVAWEDMPAHFRYGALVKLEEYSKEAYNKKTGEKVLAVRRRPRVKSFDVSILLCDDVVAMLGAKLWPSPGK